MAGAIKHLKNGKLSVPLDEDLRRVILLALRQRIHFDGEELPPYLHYLLVEAHNKLEDADAERVQLRRSEYFAIFDTSVMQYVDEPTQNLLRAIVNQFHNLIPTT